MLIVVVYFTVFIEHVAEFRAAVERQAANSLNLEEACRQFDVCYDPADDTRGLLYEVYDHRSAFDEHLASAHFREFNALVTPWVVDKQVTFWNRPLLQ